MKSCWLLKAHYTSDDPVPS